MNNDPALYDPEDLQQYYGATASSPQPQQAGTSDSLALGSTADYYSGIASPSGDNLGTPAVAVSNWTLQSSAPYYSGHGHSTAVTGESFTADDNYSEGPQPTHTFGSPDRGASELEDSHAQSGMAPHVISSSAAVTLPPGFVPQGDGSYVGPKGGLYTPTNAVHAGHQVFSVHSSRDAIRYATFSGNKVTYITRAQSSAGAEVAPPKRPKPRNSSKHMQTSGEHFIQYDPSTDYRESSAPTHGPFTQISWASLTSYDPSSGQSGSSAPPAGAHAQTGYEESFTAGYEGRQAERAPQSRAGSSRAATPLADQPQRHELRSTYYSAHGDFGADTGESLTADDYYPQGTQLAHTFGSPAAGAGATHDGSYYDDPGASELEGSQAQPGMAPQVISNSAAVTVPARLVHQGDGTYVGPRGARYTAMNAVHKGHPVFSWQNGRGETKYLIFVGNKQIYISSAQAGVKLEKVYFLREGDIVRSVWPAGTKGAHKKDHQYVLISGLRTKTDGLEVFGLNGNNTMYTFSGDPLKRTRVFSRDTTWSNTLQPAGEVAPPKPRNSSKHMQTSGEQFIQYDPSIDYRQSEAPTYGTFTQISWASPISDDPNSRQSGSSAPTAGAHAQTNYEESFTASYEGQQGERAPQRRAGSSRAAAPLANQPQQREPRSSWHSRSESHGNEMTYPYRGRGR